MEIIFFASDQQSCLFSALHHSSIADLLSSNTTCVLIYLSSSKLSLCQFVITPIFVLLRKRSASFFSVHVELGIFLFWVQVGASVRVLGVGVCRCPDKKIRCPQTFSLSRLHTRFSLFECECMNFVWAYFYFFFPI
eukprot:TRINITY_DN3808_c0_g3_i1.p1 TRINITY_DN3808_c0_g3~~TRINITY_DN3808_c0_g3_i1.p1  ORF type:complete len:136 (+),score=4.42 TRINITY_DN3808_c0_g3_i1:443-850(+)